MSLNHVRKYPKRDRQYRKHQRSEIGNRCRVIFERIRRQLIENHYN